MSVKIPQSVMKILLDRPLEKGVQGKDFSGAIAQLYQKEILLHQHCENGCLNYTYPFIQYKILKRECMIIGFHNGSELLTRLDLLSRSLRLGNQIYTVIANELNFQFVSFEMCDIPKRYSYITPWLALNEMNYKKYTGLTDSTAKKELLEKILVGNIISIAKSLGYTVPHRILLNFHHFKDLTTSLKKISMLGFLGTFSVNFSIPDLWGLGKSVSRGYGTVKQICNVQRGTL